MVTNDYQTHDDLMNFTDDDEVGKGNNAINSSVIESTVSHSEIAEECPPSTTNQVATHHASTESHEDDIVVNRNPIISRGGRRTGTLPTRSPTRKTSIEL
jgi:hypothetical protein